MNKDKYKIKDITPKKHRCVIGACPTIVETDKSSYIIIGKILKSEIINDLELSQKIGKDEIAIEIPKSLLESINK